MENKLPPYADGSIVGDYRPLLKYLELADSRGISREGLVIREDLDLLSQVLRNQERVSLKELLDMLTNRVINRLNCSLALEAFREVYRLDLDEDLACRKMAEIVSGWIIEMGKTFGIVTLRESWRP